MNGVVRERQHLAIDDDGENASDYYSCACCAAPWTTHHSLYYSNKEPPVDLWRAVLRHGKRMLVLGAQRYGAVLPVALLLVTLLVGLGLGFLVGRRFEQKSSRSRRKNSTLGNKNQHNAGDLSSSSWRMIHWARMMRWLLFCYVSVCEFWRSAVHKISKTVARKAHGSNNIHKNDEGTVEPATMHMKSVLSKQNKDNSTEAARTALRTEVSVERESGLTDAQLPRHVAVIMDGNRRYGLQHHYNNNSNNRNHAIQAGHWHGSRKLLQFAKWCLAEHIAVLTVFCFSTENWQRGAEEVAALMQLIVEHCKELRVEARAHGIAVHVVATDPEAIPVEVQAALRELVEEDPTDENDNPASSPRLQLNICLSYGSRGEIVQACRDVADDYKKGRIGHRDEIDEAAIARRLRISEEPDILIRTSGEVRLSNFLLWQLAYAELFFLEKKWPELEKQDLLEVLRSYARGRERRFGK